MRRENLSPLARWLVAECSDRGWSWTEASKRAGCDRATISLIVRGTRPGVETCRGLARLFNVPVMNVLALAGHLDGTPVEQVLHPAVRRMARDLETLPPEVQKPLLEAWDVMLKTARAAAQHRAGQVPAEPDPMGGDFEYDEFADPGEPEQAQASGPASGEGSAPSESGEPR